MSMIKDYKKMISDGEGMVNLNDISYLTYYTKDAMENDCDVLKLHFKYVCGVKGGKIYTMESREWGDVMHEIDRHTQEYMKKCADEMYNNLINGYR